MTISNITGLNAPQAKPTSEESKVDIARSEATAEQEETGSSSTTDTVSLTDTAANLQSLENTIAELPVVDSQRVEEIRSAISNGEYEVNPANIADKLLELELNG